MRKNRIVGIITCMLLFFIILGSVAVLAKNAGHQCEGEDCAVCEIIKLCECNLEGFGSVGTEAVCSALLFLFVKECICAARTKVGRHTLVSLKVELLN